MKKILYTILLVLMVAGTSYGKGFYAGGGGVLTDTNCDQAKYYPIGTLCQDSDDGKLYKGTGAAVEEIAAASGDGAPTDAHYLTDQAEGGLSAEVVVSTIGKAIVTSTNPGAIRFGRANADNSFSWLSDSDFRTAIGLAIGTDVQAYNANTVILGEYSIAVNEAPEIIDEVATDLIQKTKLTGDTAGRIGQLEDAGAEGKIWIIEIAGSYGIEWSTVADVQTLIPSAPFTLLPGENLTFQRQSGVWVEIGRKTTGITVSQYILPSYPAYITTDSTFIGSSETRIAGESISVGEWVYPANDGECYKADNDSTTWIANEAIGIAVTAGTDGNAFTVGYDGVMRLDSWTWNLNEGNPIYLSATAGAGTETRPISASEAVQEIATIISDDELRIKPKKRDFSIIRTGTDADGRTLTCLEASNTIWAASAAQTITLPQLSTCPTINVTIIDTSAGAAIVADVNASDDTIVNGVVKGDGVAWTSTSTAGDQITFAPYDSDTLIGQSSSWTAP